FVLIRHVDQQSTPPNPASPAASDHPPFSLVTKHLKELLRSNLPAPASDIPHFRDFTTSMPLELSRYNEQVARLQEQLHNLIHDRDSLIYYAAGCGSLFAPTRRVPNELLVQIFAIASEPSPISEDTTPQEELSRLGKQDLRYLSQVCSHWNSVVMNTPMLWSRIVVDLDLWARLPARRDTLRDLLEASLLRGGSFSLRITLYASGNAQREECRWVLQLLGHHSRRWWRVSLQLDLSFLQFLSSVRGRLPLLERLTIDGWKPWPDNPDIFIVAPRLKDVALTLSPMASIPLVVLPDSATISPVMVCEDEQETSDSAPVGLQHRQIAAVLAFVRSQPTAVNARRRVLVLTPHGHLAREDLALMACYLACAKRCGVKSVLKKFEVSDNDVSHPWRGLLGEDGVVAAYLEELLNSR
ncbi:hypothetical protein C8J57DRAFT_756820, partial [Mycena rebaudengoi]